MCNYRRNVNISGSLSLLPLWGLEDTLEKYVRHQCHFLADMYCNTQYNKIKAQSVDIQEKDPNHGGP